MASRQQIDGGILGPDAFFLRYFAAAQQTRLLVVNLGCDLHLASIAQPLVAPPADCRWSVLWSSEAACYGGDGTPEVDTDQGWFIPGEAAILLHPVTRNRER